MDSERTDDQDQDNSVCLSTKIREMTFLMLLIQKLKPIIINSIIGLFYMGFKSSLYMNILTF